MVLIIGGGISYLLGSRLIKRRRNDIASPKAEKSEEAIPASQTHANILELATEQAGWLALSDFAALLNMDPDKTAELLEKSKVTKNGDLYYLPDILKKPETPAS